MCKIYPGNFSSCSDTISLGLIYEKQHNMGSASHSSSLNTNILPTTWLLQSKFQWVGLLWFKLLNYSTEIKVWMYGSSDFTLQDSFTQDSTWLSHLNWNKLEPYYLRVLCQKLQLWPFIPKFQRWFPLFTATSTTQMLWPVPAKLEWSKGGRPGSKEKSCHVISETWTVLVMLLIGWVYTTIYWLDHIDWIKSELYELSTFTKKQYCPEMLLAWNIFPSDSWDPSPLWREEILAPGTRQEANAHLYQPYFVSFISGLMYSHLL